MEQHQHKIPRKPLRVPTSPLSPPPPYLYVESPTTLSAATEYSSYDASLFDDYATPSASTQTRPEFLGVDDQLEPNPATPPLRSTQSSPNLQVERRNTAATISATSQKAGKAVTHAFEEARHFAGGLVSHPYESTKHYSILRHSHGLVFYSGSYTNIAITIFSDRPLPPDRSFWIQRRGWSGKAGLRAGVLFGTHSAWLDVTPDVVATPDQIKPTDERAWQRDIGKFLRKAPRKIAGHVPRETAVVRVPCNAEDGYLRIVMCAGEGGKKHLCPSPVFRLASTSLESSSLRGASLKTLPLEAAVKVGTAVGTRVAKTAAAPYIASVRMLVSTEVGSIYQPTAMQQISVQQATDGVLERVENLNSEYDQRRGINSNAPVQQGEVFLPQARIFGSDDGPTSPFPVRFHGKVTSGTGLSTQTFGIPTANLTNVDSTITWRHNGVYAGYASIALPKKRPSEVELSDEWHQAVISILPASGAQVDVVQRKHVSLHILHDFHGTKFFDAKVSVMLMCLIHPPISTSPTASETLLETQKAHFYNDILSTSATLSRPNWAAEMTIQRVKTASSGRSMTDRYVDMRQGMQDQVDKVPIHRLGIRMESHGARDGFVGRGGIVIPR